MAITPEEFQDWKARHAATTARMFEVIERWRGRRPWDPETRAAYDRDHQAIVKEFEQFKDMPDEVWDELLADWPDETA
jgi:hypothetical protein